MARDGSSIEDSHRAEQARFRGYNAIRYTPCPDEFFDFQLAVMDDDELRVTLYAFRRTFGFKKTGDAISISQFLQGITTRDGRRLDLGCGLKTPRQVLNGLAKAEARGVLISRFFCRRCGNAVPPDSMIDEERSQRLVNGAQHTYRVRVVPRTCLSCGTRLRGFEEKRYELNVLSDDEISARRTATSVTQIDALVLGGSVVTTEDDCAQASGPSASVTDTRDSTQQTVLQACGETHHDVVDESTTMAGGWDGEFIVPRCGLSGRQLWMAVSTRLRPQLERQDGDGWFAATRLLAAVEDTGGDRVVVTVGAPTEHAARRLGGRLAEQVRAGLSDFIPGEVDLRVLTTSEWALSLQEGRASAPREA